MQGLMKVKGDERVEGSTRMYAWMRLRIKGKWKMYFKPILLLTLYNMAEDCMYVHMYVCIVY